MLESTEARLVVLSPAAQRDLQEAIRWSEERFGDAASLRYRTLIVQALRDLAADSERAGSKLRPEIAVNGVRTYHLAFSRRRVQGKPVKMPRHFVLYRAVGNHRLEVGRILHDRRDLSLPLKLSHGFLSSSVAET